MSGRSHERGTRSRTERTGAREQTWRLGSIGITVILVLLTASIGLIVLPLLQRDVSYSSLWDAICSAAGVRQFSANQAPIEPAFKTSQVVLTSDMFRNPGAQSIGRGATLGQRCAICHGLSGVSRADSPNLAGQYAAVIYKELLDFRSGVRVNAVMSPFAEALSGSGHCRSRRLLRLLYRACPAFIRRHRRRSRAS